MSHLYEKLYFMALLERPRQLLEFSPRVFVSCELGIL